MKPFVLFQLTFCAAVAATSPALATAKTTARTHVVADGQRLDSIAKRYGVSSEQLRQANGLPAGALLKIGQRLTIPSVARADQDAPRSHPSEGGQKNEPSIVKVALLSSEVAPIRHRVVAGETLSEIALRAGTSVEEISTRNKLSKGQPLRVGQVLVLPSVVRAARKSWQPYVRSPKQRGALDVSTPFARFSGPVLEASGRLRPQAVRTLNDLLGAGGSHPALPERLVRLLLEVSDIFGGRPIRLVSGYRTASYYQDSRHKVSSAIDFLVVGVPNSVVCDYLRELEDVGVGYYPNSSFVHLDVRDHSAYWVDYAGPGEPPRSSPNGPASPPARRPLRSAERKLLAELDSVLEQTKSGIEKARHARPNEAPAEATRGGFDALALSVPQREPAGLGAPRD